MPLRHDHDRGFRSSAAANPAGCSSNHVMLAERHEQLDFLRGFKIGNWDGIDKNADRARRSHEAAVALHDEAA